MQTKLILGPPGTGKTTRLLEILSEELGSGISPRQIAFVSFTRKGAYEARDRVLDQFPYSQRELPFFKTLHSIAFKATGAQSAQVLQREHYKELGEMTGFPFKGFIREDDPFSSALGDTLMFILGYARNTRQSLENTWKQIGRDIDWMKLRYMHETLEKYKRTHHLIDFTDMIEQFIEEQESLPVTVAMIDEAQDLSKLQWEMAKLAFSDVDRLYIAGDDDQAIYQWSGADVQQFLSLQADQEILANSHRIPQNVFKIGQSISSKIRTRYEKLFLPKAAVGSVQTIPFLDLIKLNTEQTWLLLARNRYLLREYEDLVEQQGFAYSTKKGTSINSQHQSAIYSYERRRRGQPITEEEERALAKFMPRRSIGDIDKESPPWFDALQRMAVDRRVYYQAVLRQGGVGALRKAPNIHIDTIHGVKGGEADNVVLMSDISYRTWEGLETDPDQEHRVFYVGSTRAKENLFLVQPQTDLYYRF